MASLMMKKEEEEESLDGTHGFKLASMENRRNFEREGKGEVG